MDIQLLNKVTDELKSEILGGIISNVHQPVPAGFKQEMDERNIILKIFLRGKEKKLLISLHPRFFRIHLTQRRYENPPTPLRFCSYLRSHLTNKRIEDIKVLAGERIVHVLFKDFIMIIELTGRDSNIILTNKDMLILDALRYFPQEKGCPRPVMPELKYIPPPHHERDLTGFDISIGDSPSFNESVDKYYGNLEDSEMFEREKANLGRVVNDVKKRLERKLGNLFEDRKRAEENLTLSKHGELLLANFSKIKRGMKEIKVIDYYHEPPQEMSIQLDPALLPQENIDKIFKRVKKAKTAIGLLKARIPQIEDEIRYLEETQYQLDTLEDKDDISGIKEALVNAGYIKKQGQGLRVKGQGKSKTEPIRRFKSTDGCEILCGKTASSNDLLVKKYARANDLWFHAYGVAGSHVLLRLKNSGDEPSQNSIIEAGTIAAFFSKGRNSFKAEVAYTLAKNVKKPKGAKPGLVTISNYKTIMVKIDEGIVEKLKEDNK